jgi:hypothetical protein
MLLSAKMTFLILNTNFAAWGSHTAAPLPSYTLGCKRDWTEMKDKCL